MSGIRNTSNYRAFKNASSLKNKVAIFFILICMIVNGFTISAVDVSKSSFVLVMGIIGHNVVINIFKHCNNSIIILSDSILQDIQKTFFSLQLSENISGNQEQGKKSTEPARGDNNTIAINLPTLADIKKIPVACMCVFASGIELFKLYMSCKIISEDVSLGMILLAFIIFILALRRRKIIVEVFASLVKNKNLSIYKIVMPSFMFFI